MIELANLGMRIGSLCSGVGGLELGLEWAGLGQTVWQVEIDPFCRRILSKHWPSARRFADVHHVGKKNLSYADLICFGFPCQDVSSAGTKVGLGGAQSGLFYECARVVEEIGPEWVVVENVTSGAKLWVDAVTGKLGELGYGCLPIPLQASDVGALHLRARIFVVAHSDRQRQRAESGLTEVASAPSPAGAGASDADRVELRQLEQRHARRDNGVRDTRKTESEFPGWWEPEPNVVRVVHGLPEGLDATWDGAHRLAALRAADELASVRVAALGNSVVPQCTEVVGWVIRELIEEAAA